MLLDTKNHDDEFLPTDTVLDRWGDAASTGFIPVPNTLVRAQAKLGLSANDLVVLLNILLHWWHRDRLPHPRSTAIAMRSGLSLRTVQRSLRDLQEKGLITRIRGTKIPTRYDLKGLRAALAKETRRDRWYRPGIVQSKSPGDDFGAEAGVQTPPLVRS